MTLQRRVWFARRFEFGLQVEALPDVIERIRGTPARLDERLEFLEPSRATWRATDQVQSNGRWSIQENVGHLADLEPLWLRRLEELLAGVHTLSAADLRNRATDEADHNARALLVIRAQFRRLRTDLIRRLEELDSIVATRTALHPRLLQPMSVTDLAFFVAEHDDHHLARISELLRLAPADSESLGSARPAAGVTGG